MPDNTDKMDAHDEYLLESKLAKEAPGLSMRMRGAVAVLTTTLDKYLLRFPTFTDHSLRHSMDVLDYCNQIIGPEQVKSLNPQECYALIMSCYLHDVGMGIGHDDYVAFSQDVDFGDYFCTHDRDDEAEIIRAFHQEYSGLFIRKYGDVFDIPSRELRHAVIQIARGHRKADLYDEREYADIVTSDGTIRTAYLAAVMRLADEIDYSHERNPYYLFGTMPQLSHIDKMWFGIHASIREVVVGKESIVLLVAPQLEEYIPLIENLRAKMQESLLYCRGVAARRSDLRIKQREVLLRYA